MRFNSLSQNIKRLRRCGYSSKELHCSISMPSSMVRK